MKSLPRPPRTLPRAGVFTRGFTLIEILVGMAIGVIGMIVMMQIFLVSEATKRTTAGGGDAQTNGTSALYSLTRDIGHSGYAITSQSLVGCNLTLRTGVTLNSLAPLTINHASIPAGDANTDTLLVAFASSGGSPEGDVIILQPSTNVYSVTAPTSFAVNDWIVAQAQTRPATCNLTMEKIITRTSSPPNLTVTTGVASVANGTLFNLGAAPQFLAYAIRRGNLTVCDYMVSNCSDATLTTSDSVWAPIASGIVNMRVQYARDTAAAPMDGVVDIFDQITPGSTADVSGFTRQCSIARVQAARFVLVARSGAFEKTDVTASAPTWSGSAGAPIDLSKLPDGTANADWKKYRYKVLQTVVPMRNLVSLGAQAGC
jgi:type IV pilus assembly protein PilW